MLKQGIEDFTVAATGQLARPPPAPSVKPADDYGPFIAPLSLVRPTEMGQISFKIARNCLRCGHDSVGMSVVLPAARACCLWLGVCVL